jgi:hypothetical protein
MRDSPAVSAQARGQDVRSYFYRFQLHRQAPDHPFQLTVQHKTGSEGDGLMRFFI